MFVLYPIAWRLMVGDTQQEPGSLWFDGTDADSTVEGARYALPYVGFRQH